MVIAFARENLGVGKRLLFCGVIGDHELSSV